MKRLIKNVLCTGLFLVLLIGLLSGINWVLRPKYTSYNSRWPETTTFGPFYDLEKDSVDVLFLGSSVCANAFSPQEIYNAYGIRSYNLGSEQQSPILSYYWLREALRFHDLKAVVLDVKLCYPYLENSGTTNMSEPIMRKCLDPMHWSRVKMEAVSEVCRVDSQQNPASYYFTNIRFHRRWDKLNREDFQVDDPSFAQLKGFAPLIFKGQEAFEPLVLRDEAAREEMLPNMQVYVDQMAALCREKEIDFILVNLPGYDQTEGRHNSLVEYAKEQGIDFYDLGEESLYHAIGAKQPDEVIVHHQNLWGAMLTSRWMGGMLAEKYGVPAVQDAQYEESRENYERLKLDAQLPFIEDFETYLQHIQNPRYMVLMTMNNALACSFSQEAAEQLRSMNIESIAPGTAQMNFFAVARDGFAREGMGENDILTDCGRMPNGQDWYEVTVSAPGSGAAAQSIVISGKEHAPGSTGLQIVVYDMVSEKVLDSVCFQPGEQEMTGTR